MWKVTVVYEDGEAKTNEFADLAEALDDVDDSVGMAEDAPNTPGARVVEAHVLWVVPTPDPVKEDVDIEWRALWTEWGANLEGD